MHAVLSSDPPPGIALFDLDGTLLAWDTQLLFRHHVIRRQPWRGLLLPVFLASLPAFPILKLAGLKRAFLSYLWRMPAPILAAHARAFATTIVPTIYPDLREALEDLQKVGADLYAHAQQAAAAAPGGAPQADPAAGQAEAEPKPTKKTEKKADVVDADFEVVDDDKKK